jgi:hypothetical protein
VNAVRSGMRDCVKLQSACVILDTPTWDVATFGSHAQYQRRYSQAMSVSTAPTVREKRRKSSGSASRKRKSKKNPGWLAQWWPLLIGIAVTPFAIHFASIMALAGPRALMMLYPWVLLLKTPALGLSNLFAADLSQLLMYIQFPVYGLLMSVKLGSKPLWIALSLAVALHLVGILGIFVTTAHI